MRSSTLSKWRLALIISLVDCRGGHHLGIWQGGQHNPDIGSVMFRYDLPNRGTKLDWTDVQQLLKISKPKR